MLYVVYHYTGVIAKRANDCKNYGYTKEHIFRQQQWSSSEHKNYGYTKEHIFRQHQWSSSEHKTPISARIVCASATVNNSVIFITKMTKVSLSDKIQVVFKIFTSVEILKHVHAIYNRLYLNLI